MPSTEAMLMIEPPPAFRRCGNTARESCQSPRTLVLKVIPLLLRDLFNVSRVKYSSVVYQDIDSAERIHRPFDQSFNVSPLRHIRGHGYGPCACFAGYLLDPVLAAAHQNDAGALADQS